MSIMKKSEFKETFSEIPGNYELPKKISNFFEQNKGGGGEVRWLQGLLQSFEKSFRLSGKNFLYEYKARFVDK